MQGRNAFPFFMSVALLLLSGFSLQAQCAKHQGLIDKMDQSMQVKDPELLRDIYHPNIKRHTQEGTIEGIDQMIANTKQFYQDIPDANGVNEDIICTEDKIVMRWTGSGTPKGAPGKITVTGITIAQVKDGKIIEEWEEMNSIAMMMQMGYELKPPAGGN